MKFMGFKNSTPKLEPNVESWQTEGGKLGENEKIPATPGWG